MSKKVDDSPKQSTFEYDCDCGKHFVRIGEAVAHINKFKDHHLKRITV
jgi:predicted SprT family Zn-dependent metalloprotease